ncbi:cholinesterase 1 [Tetranychus urticae]|uniref:Carboxylic ester hydrolase n=1 Tax=Tetranychus urticae TaxID=32264 RepID=A0A158P517_TETUR|nr:cholinesterase 1 [Tetranychus urticae]
MKLLIPIVFLFCFTLQISCQTRSWHYEPILKISPGLIKGTSVDFRGVKVYQFLGIPYAEPPLDELRFKKPVPKKPWNGVLSVNKWSTACMQPVIPGVNGDDLTISEDCLILNVFTTQDAFQDQRNGNQNELRPVMVWIHGGSFVFGSASKQDSYDGTPLVAIKDVIVVALNYRLGPLGFLHLPEAGVPGNMGLWDQQLALKWVKDNIEYFGGDPDKVTIFGESAGAVSVSAHLISPQSRGLFKNVILQSGSIYGINLFTIPNVGRQFLDKINCESNDYKSCLANYEFGQYPEADRLVFWPIVGDRFLPNNPEELVANGVDPNINVLLGTLSNEGIFFLLVKDNITFNPSNPVDLTIPHARYIFGELFGKKLIDVYSELYLDSIPADDSDAIRLAVAQALGDVVISGPTYAFGRDLVANGVSNVYAYIQTQKPKSYGSVNQTWSSNIPTHTDDLPMVFGRPFIEPEQYNIEDGFLSFLMMDIWTKFAKGEKLPKISYQEWLAWGQNNNNPYNSIVLDSKKLGWIETEHVEFCIENWPFPVEKPIDLYPQNLTMKSNLFITIP